MKMLQVIDTLDAGGAERVLVDLLNILYENGMEVAVCTIVNRGNFGVKLNNGIEHYNVVSTNNMPPNLIASFNQLENIYLKQ